MPKRTTHQVPVAEKMAKLRTWQKHPEWTVKDAVQNLNVKKGTLIGWRNQYSDPQLKHIRVPPDVGNRIREKGGGRKHRTTSYEFDVLSFYDNCAREGEIPSHASILSYCQNIPEFALKKDKSQHSWVREFIKRYKTHHSSKTNSNSASNYKVCQAEDAESDNDPIPVSPTNDTFTSDIMTQNTTVSDERKTPGNLEYATADKQDIFHPHDIDSTISFNCSTPSSGQPESGNEDSSNDVRAASESDDSNNDVSAASESSEAWCSNTDSETVHSKMILRSGKCKGCTTNSIVFTYEVHHYENGETSRKFVMATDLHSLLPCKQLTAGVMDFFIYRFMGAAVGAVFTFGCPIFHGIEAAVVAQKGSNIALDMMSNFNWNVYPYLLLPVVKNNHISLLICEHPMTTNAIIYRIDSLGCTDGGHKTKELFEAMQWVLERESQKSRTDVPLYSYKTAPLQSNSYDCGVITLHYLDKICRYLMQHKPISLLHDIEKQCSGFGSAKAERARARMHTKLQQDIAKPIELD